MNKNAFFGLLVIVLAFGFIGCEDPDSSSNWWTWMDTASSANISFTPNPSDSGGTVVVTGTANSISDNWRTQLLYGYNAVGGKTYSVSFSIQAIDNNFENVVIRIAQRSDNVNDPLLFSQILTISTEGGPVSDTFTLPPGNYENNFTFMVGSDTGSFRIWDMKILQID